MMLLPKRGLSYTGIGDLTFVDKSSICYPFGSRMCIPNLNLHEGGVGGAVFLGDTVAISESDAQSGDSFCTITAIATSWREGRVALATANVVSPSIILYSYPDRKERGRLVDGNCLFYNSIAFSRGGDRIVAFGNHSDSQIIVWTVTKEENSASDGGKYKLSGQELIRTSIRGNITFCDFNPINKNHIVTGGESGLVLWSTVDLEDEWHITRKYIAGGGAKDSVVGSSYSLKDHNKSPFTCHAWGNCGMLWVGLLGGEIQCFNSKNGDTTTDQQPVYKSYLGNCSTPTGLIYTRDHLIVATEEGNVYWYSIPSRREPLSLVLSVALTGVNNQSHRVSNIACSPMFDQFVVGMNDGALLSLPLEHSKHKEGVANVTELSTYHSGVVLCCISFHPFDLSVHHFNVLQNIMATGGEDGFIRLHTVEYGKLCGLMQFLQQEDTECRAKTKAVDDGSSKTILSSIHSTASSLIKKAVPVTALAASFHFPLIAAGLCNGVVHVLFQRIDIDRKVDSTPSVITPPGNQAVSLTTLWQERLYGGQSYETPVNVLEFHPTEALLAVASSGDSVLHVVDMRFPERLPFKVHTCASSPHDEGDSITSFVWRNNDIVFTTNSKGICCVGVDMSSEAAAYSLPSTLKWVLQMSIPLQGICLNPTTSCDSFFGVSTQSQALLVLAAPPSEVIAARSTKCTIFVDFLSEASYQQPPSSIVRSSRCGQFLAKGSIDGFVTLWGMKQTTQTEHLDRVRLHSGPILDLCFSPDSTHIISSATDGTVMSVELVVNPHLGGVQRELVVQTAELPRKSSLISRDTPPPPPSEMITTYVSRLAVATTQGAPPPFDEEGLDSYEPMNQAVWRESDSHNNHQPQLDSEIDKDLNKTTDLVHRVNNFKNRLVALLERNNTLPDIERLEPEDFLVDINGGDAKQAENSNAAKALQKELHDKCTNKELVCSRIVAECQRSMEVLACEVRGLRKQELVVDNFAMSKRRNAIDVQHTTSAIRRLRALELKDIRRSSTNKSSSSTPSHLRTWKRLHNEIPENVAWILNEGSHAPVVVDVVSELKQKRRGEEFLAINGKKSNLRKSKSLDLDISGLLYPPWAIWTPRQIQTQIMLLESLVWEMRVAFNQHFDALREHKQEVVEKINQMKERLGEISEEMGRVEEEEELGLLLEPPKWWYSRERIDDELLLQNTTEDKMIKQQLFISCLHTQAPAATDKKATNEAEKGTVEMDASWRDKEQALKCMMNGNPRILNGTFSHTSLPRPHWLGGKLGAAADNTTAVLILTQEQENQVAIYEHAAMTLEDNNQRRHMAKKLEARNLRAEIEHLFQNFDDGVQELASMRLEVHQRIKAQELNISRLSLKLMEYCDDNISIQELDNDMSGANKAHNTCKERCRKYKKKVKISRDKIKDLEAHDRSLEMSFKKDIREAASSPTDVMDTMPQLIERYKLRGSHGDIRCTGMETSTTRDGESFARGTISVSHVLGDRLIGETVPSHRRSTLYGGAAQKQSSYAGWSRKRQSLRQSIASNSIESFSTSSYAGGTELGPLPHAMKAALARQIKPAISDKDPFAFADKELDRQMNQDSDSQCDLHGLEFPGFDVEDQVWNRLVELRAAKINSEELIGIEQEKVHDMECRQGILQSELRDAALAVEQLEKRKRKLTERALAKQRNIDMVVMLQQSQDEVVTDDYAFENQMNCRGGLYEEAVLCPVGVVSSLNDRISRLGEAKINTLHQIENITSSIDLQRWKEAMLKAEVQLMNQTCNDIQCLALTNPLRQQMLRVTRRLQSMIKRGKKKGNDKEILPTATETETPQTIGSANISAMKEIRHGEDKVQDELQFKRVRLKNKLKSFQKENEKLEKRLCLITERSGAAMDRRKAIQPRAEASASDKNPGTTVSIKTETLLRHLKHLTKAQATEIQALSVELQRQRERAVVYPSFEQDCLKVSKLIQHTGKPHMNKEIQ